MSDEIAISLDRVTKDYKRGSAATMGLKAALLHPVDYLRQCRGKQRFRALDDITLTIRKGECLGIVGRNGSGKSTMLGLIAGVLAPNSGTVTTHGRISPLLELGAGFHHELTGRENILLNGVLLGMTRREVLSRMDKMIEFSELAGFINEPIRTYSSGMLARLGFSVAVHLEPQILLVDEVLAVGDEPFQAKCFHKIRDFHAQGVTTVVVSHSQKMIEDICDRAALVNASRLVAVGTPGEVFGQYRAILDGP